MGKRRSKTSAFDLIQEAHSASAETQIRKLQAKVAERDQRIKSLEKHGDKLAKMIAENRHILPVPKKLARRRATKHLIRLTIPDSHGLHIDVPARDAFLRDIEYLDVDEVVWLGDHLDAGGTFNAHQRSYTSELTESYAGDIDATNDFLNLVMERCRNARHYYIFGNHEAHIERWAAREFSNYRDAKLAVDRLGPAAVLELKKRGFEWFVPHEMYHGLSTPGLIKLGKCHFTHGMSHAKNADEQHLALVGGNVVFGHVHRTMMTSGRSASATGFSAWCPGTLAKLQALYQHTRVSQWQHGYGVQFANATTGTFAHFQVPLVGAHSYLAEVVNARAPK